MFHATCIASGYSLAHEVGHVLGAAHDTYSAKGEDLSGVPVRARGYVLKPQDDSEWRRTIMAYDDECAKNQRSCARVLRWSDPDDLTFGEPLGVPDGFEGRADNQSVLVLNHVDVARYRRSGCRILDSC